jgi:SAM-dependent methyltransferase
VTTTEPDFEARFLSGRALYGDDFTPAEIEAWYDDEREGYANLGSGAEDNSSGRGYGYHNFNRRHAFRYLPPGPLGDALGLGAAYGDEFAPIIDRVDSITILEPSKALRSPAVKDVALKYVDPAPSGLMPFDDASFDLVTSFGVLHHIPNVTTVVNEVVRVLRRGGLFVVREPIHSMGDWRRPRRGLTSRERGIPRRIFEEMVESRLSVIHASLCDFPLRQRIGEYDAPWNVALDAALSRLFAFNYRYHARTTWQKVRPCSLAIVLRKD